MSSTTIAHHTLVAAPTARLPQWRTFLFRIGIVLTVFMGTMNTINGGSALLGMQPGESSPVVAGLLFSVGLPTLLLAGLAWIPKQWALITVVVLRFLEAGTMWIPMGPGDWYTAPENRPFYLVLVVASLVVCALMALGLRKRQAK